MQGFKIKYFKVNSYKGEFLTGKRGKLYGRVEEISWRYGLWREHLATYLSRKNEPSLNVQVCKCPVLTLLWLVTVFSSAALGRRINYFGGVWGGGVFFCFCVGFFVSWHFANPSCLINCLHYQEADINCHP